MIVPRAIPAPRHTACTNFLSPVAYFVAAEEQATRWQHISICFTDYTCRLTYLITYLIVYWFDSLLTHKIVFLIICLSSFLPICLNTPNDV